MTNMFGRTCLVALAVFFAISASFANGKVENCQRWSQDTCNFCDYGYGTTPDKKKCLPCKDPRCTLCNNDQSVCPGCQNGYGFDTNKKCIKCTVSKCTVCQESAGICSICEDGHGPNLKGDACLPCTDTHCRLCYADQKSTPTVCTVCKEGYAFSKDNKCIKCPKNIPGDQFCQNGLESEAASAETSDGRLMARVALAVFSCMIGYLTIV